jgi:hypothetical protein
MPIDYYPNRPWSIGNNPLTALNRFLDFNKYQVFKINYKVRFLCISPKDLIFIFAKKHPYSLPEIIFKSILRKKKKYLISGAWVSENQQMYKTIDESERPFDSNIII